ncbi:hypothetical protein CVIRNUC_002274 [Coccomyxa viridis]|uniref:Glutaredoxin domain-containing protein n=1 Tax=Coccomyxa viridis TaxID=1274662 RepID=A0AAV1HWE6_9CHLO|nr:hypothetical protein CVIRNUC_002274 [Coccomyxa viridis]
MGGFCSKAGGKAKEKVKSGKGKDKSIETPPAERPSRYLKDDGPVVDQGNKNPGEPKKEADMSVKQFVDSTIKNNKVVIWSKSYCPFCKKAKQAIFSLVPPDEVEVVELDLHPKGDEIQDYLKEITGGRSVPRVFIGGKFVGGGDDVVAKLKTGELEKMLKEVGAIKA